MEECTALITGAAKGIGREIAFELSKKGYFVIVNYKGSNEEAAKTVHTIKEKGGKAIEMRCDVSDFLESQNMIKEIISITGRIDVIVNNAGIAKDGLLVHMKETDYDHVVNTNLKGTFNICKHASRQMIKQRKGSILNITSVSGIYGNAGQANYSAAKAGIIGLTKTLSKELGSRGIRVNALAPGFIITDMVKDISDKNKEEILKRISLRRFGTVEEIAKTASFLLSDEAGYITGQVICTDGGICL